MGQSPSLKDKTFYRRLPPRCSFVRTTIFAICC